MAVMLLAYYEVADVDRFLHEFDGFENARRVAGAVTRGLVRSTQDPAAFVALIEFTSEDAARGFAQSPERARALIDGGVLSRTDEFLEVVRTLDVSAAV